MKETFIMEQVFSYIISLGASVMMPILFTIIGLCIGMKFGKALKSGLYVGVGFVGLGIVTALLNELDGFTKNEGILVLAATNSIAALDEALIRPGRFDARYSVPYPDADTREKLSEFYLRGKKYDSEVTPQSLSKLFSGFSSAKIESVLNNAVLTASQNERDAFTLEDVKAAAAALKNV